MDRNYPILGKLGIALIFSCLALFLPFLAAKIVFAGIAGILFALCFKKFRVLMIIFFVIVMLVMSASYFVHDFISGLNLPWFMQRNWMMNGSHMEYSLGFNSRVVLVNPDTAAAVDKILIVKGHSVRINYKEDIEKVYFPDEMKMTRDSENDVLVLDGMELDENKTLVLDVPAEFPFLNLKVYAQAATIMGDTLAEDIEYHIDALNVQGNYQTEHLYTENSVLNWSGILNGNDFIFEADAANFNGDVEQMRHFEFDSEVLNGNLYFKESWDGERVVELKAAIGKFDIRRPVDSDSILHVNHEGDLFNVNISEYNYSDMD